MVVGVTPCSIQSGGAKPVERQARAALAASWLCGVAAQQLPMGQPAHHAWLVPISTLAPSSKNT